MEVCHPWLKTQVDKEAMRQIPAGALRTLLASQTGYRGKGVLDIGRDVQVS